MTKIDPPGPGKPTFNPLDESQKISRKPERPFSVGRYQTEGLKGSSLIEKAQQAHFPGVAAQFSKSDLRNPQKVDNVVRSSVQELIETEFPQARFSSEEARKNFVDLVANDPFLRPKLLRCLESVLKQE